MRAYTAHKAADTSILQETRIREKPVAVLKSLYCQMFGRVETFGIGDGPNDLPMLKIVDKPFFIKKKAGVNSSFIAWTGILQLISKAVVK